jgi:hypothetical protein
MVTTRTQPRGHFARLASHALEREHIDMMLVEEVEKSFADVAAGRTRDARTTLNEMIKSVRQSVAPSGRASSPDRS